MKEMLKTIGWTMLATVVYYFMEVLFNALFQLVLRGVSDPQECLNLVVIANLILKLVVLFVFGFWYMVRESKWHYRPDYRKNLSPKTLACLVGTGLLGQYALGFVMIFIRAAVPDVFREYTKVTELLRLDSAYPFVTLIMVVVAGPVAEELLFRGVIYGRLRHSFTVLQAAVISAALFGIYHKNIIQGVYAAAFGIILAYIFEKTQTIWGCVVMHMMFNLSSYLMNGLAALMQKTGLSIPASVYVAFYVVCIVVVVLCICSLRRMPNRYDEIRKRMEMLEE